MITIDFVYFLMYEVGRNKKEQKKKKRKERKKKEIDGKGETGQEEMDENEGTNG